MDKNVVIYNYAVEFLNEIKPDNVELQKYYLGDKRDFMSLKDVYIQFIKSAQNYRGMPKIIKFEERRSVISRLLHDFDYSIIKDMNYEDIYYSFRKSFSVTSADGIYNSWLKWSKSIVDSARYVSGFESVEDFVKFVKIFDYNNETRMALPLLISKKISGIGFALACDLLKELGFTNYPKPDGHLKDVFSGVRLCENDDISTFEAIVKMSDACKSVDADITPYKVDKIIWLICTGDFYLESQETKIESNKKKFIENCISIVGDI